MQRIGIYVIFFCVFTLILYYTVSEKNDFSEAHGVWTFCREGSTNDGSKIMLYEDETRFNRYTVHPDGTKSRRIFLKNKPVVVWDKNLSYSSDKAIYADVISPPLYALENNNGELFMRELSKTDEYIKKCNKPVWGMFTNGFNPDNTRLLMNDSKKRTEIASFITDTAHKHGLQGVNIDFENMYAEDSHLFTQFIMELSEKLHQKDIILSVDVTKINKGSMFYSMCYNRAELGKYADYIVLMAYDQFPRTSEVAGPVASISWTEDAIVGMLPEVPTEKLLLGIPFYTRSWEETNGVITACPAISMVQSQNLISAHSPTVSIDEDSGLHYFEYTDGGKIYKIWQENADSIMRRCSLADKYNLAGLACWSLDFESAEINDILSQY